MSNTRGAKAGFLTADGHLYLEGNAPFLARREFLIDLLKKHERVTETIGAGVKHFTVENAKGGTQCFYIMRVDGSREDFSTGKCLKN